MSSDGKGGSVATTQQQLRGEGWSFHASHNGLIKSKLPASHTCWVMLNESPNLTGPLFRHL